MSREVLILREADIRALLDPAACVDAVELAFTAYSTGQAQLLSVIALDVAENNGEIHMKAVRKGSSRGAGLMANFSRGMRECKTCGSF